MGESRRYGCGTLVALILACCLSWLLISAGRRGVGPTPAIPQAPRAEPSPEVVPSGLPSSRPAPPLDLGPAEMAVGSTVILSRPGGAGHAHLSLDREAYEQLGRAYVTKDMRTFVRLSDEGRVLRVENGTRAVVLAVGPESRRVRLTEGSKAGVTGWVEELQLRPVADHR